MEFGNKIQMAGITTVEDALMCEKAGINMIGLLVGQKHTSNEFISKEKAKEIKDALKPGTEITLIMHLENARKITQIAKFIGVKYIQLHSDIAESEVAKIDKALPNVNLIRIIHISTDGEILTDIDKIKYADFYFTDSINEATGQVGGTGLEHNYKTDEKLCKTLNKPVFVAGGLTAENVANVILKCQPFGVDVNSGCRANFGGRDKRKTVQFVKNANEAFQKVISGQKQCVVYYVRHGQTQANVKRIYTGTQDVSLTEVGKKQAQTTAKKLKDIDFDIVYCSPLLRARQTMEEITKYHKKTPVIFDERLIERAEYEPLAGKPLGKSNILRWIWGIKHKKEFGEPLEDSFERVCNFYEDILKKHKGQKVLIVAHAGIGILTKMYFRGQVNNGYLSKYQVSNANVYMFVNK